MSRQCYYLVNEDQQSRLENLLSLLGFFMAMAESKDRIEVKADEMLAFLISLHQELEVVKTLPFQFLELAETDKAV